MGSPEEDQERIRERDRRKREEKRKLKEETKELAAFIVEAKNNGYTSADYMMDTFEAK
jgi:hypothetical protein